MKDLIWVPSLTSVGLLEFRSMGTIRSHERLALTHMPERRLFYQTLTLVTFSCSMDFSDFPFDKNVCYFQVSFKDLFLSIVLAKVPREQQSPSQAGTTVNMS